MTLVLSALTRDAVLQASDRRLVWIQDGAVIDKDDMANKAVLYCGRVAFSYTGVADMGRKQQRTDEWLAEVLSRAPGQTEALRLVAEEATARFEVLASMLPAELRRHEFVGVGWARFPPEHREFEPYYCWVSNVRDGSGQPTSLTPEFRWGALKLGSTECLAATAGQRLTDEEYAQTLSRIETALDGGVLELGEAMVTTVRTVAEHNDYVGKDVLLTSFPRAAVETQTEGQFYIAGPPGGDTATFLYVPEGVSDGTQYGPIVTCEG